MNRALLTMAILGASFACGIFSSSLKADEWDKKTTIAIDNPITVSGTVLLPGRYVLKLADTDDRSVVSIYNEDETRVVTTVAAAPAQRLHATSEPQFFFRETSKGSPASLRIWYFAGEHYGIEFLPQGKAVAAPQAAPAD